MLLNHLCQSSMCSLEHQVSVISGTIFSIFFPTLIFSVIIKIMLEKNKNFSYFDAHFHYAECKKLHICDFPENWSGISCAHSKEEWEIQQTAPNHVCQSYGIHPLMLVSAHFDIQAEVFFLEKLILEQKICAIGEAGFDFFTKELKSSQEIQEKAFNIQLELAQKYSLPLIIHCRKANEKLFEYAKELSKVKEVLFHSFMGSSVEGMSLLRKGINAYFSFGKQIFNNNKKVLDCVKNLPPERVLAETDAPFQFLQGEEFTRPNEIVKIQEEIKRLKTTND